MQQPRKLRWMVIAAMALGLVISGGYYVASPWLMLARLQSDAQARNVSRMENYVDFPAVRASIKTQIQSHLKASIGDRPDNRIIALGMALADAMIIDPVVTMVASPQGIVALINGENPLPELDQLNTRLAKPAKLRLSSATTSQSKYKRWKLSYTGLNQAIVHVTPPKEGSPFLILSRHGLLTWKVTDIQLGSIF